jgi:putative aldouronate transport system permease protein
MTQFSRQRSYPNATERGCRKMTVTTPDQEARAGASVEPYPRRQVTVWQRVWRERWMYAFLAPGLLFFVIFKYVPLLGNVAAFQDYSPYLGFRGSAWVGFENFSRLFTDIDVIIALKNTLIISLLQIVFAFPAPIALALLLNSIMSSTVKRFIQSVVYLPHFIGWVILIALWQEVLGGAGMVNQILQDHGMSTINFMTDPSTFKLLITAQVMWKEIGWGTIIFLAAITQIGSDQYEAAVVDGAGPWRRIWHVTLPGMVNIIVLLLILRLGSVLTVGFEQILLQQPAVGADAAQVLDTFVYYRGVLGGDWGLSTAVGLLKGVIGTFLVVGANKLAKRAGTGGLF